MKPKHISVIAYSAENCGGASLIVLPLGSQSDLSDEIYATDAESVMKVLNCLPSGTVDRVLQALLEQNIRYYHVATMDETIRNNCARMEAALEVLKERNKST